MWYVVVDEDCSDPAPESRVWTLSKDPKRTGWETDSGFPGYGLTKAKAQELADAANRRYAYILSDYGEYGAEHVAATFDRSRLLDLLDENWPDPKEVDVDKPKPRWRQEHHAKLIAEAKVKLSEALKESDRELSKRNGINLTSGWGGMQLHVVTLR